MSFDRVLCAVDFSPESQRAFRAAQDLCGRLGAALTVLHVVPVATVAPDSPALWSVLEPPAGSDPATDLLENMRMEAVGRGVRVEGVRTVHGDPAGEIARIAREDRYDLIVMGTHGRSGWKRMVLGSVTEHVLRHGSCPVLAVCPP